MELEIEHSLPLFNICRAIQELFRAQELLALKKGDDVTVKAKRQAFIYRQIRPKNSQRKLAAGWSKCWQARPVARCLNHPRSSY
jgi:hypothetical protein